MVMSIRVVLIALICALSADGSFSHTKMTGSVPAEGATARAGLAKIQLGFAQPVRLMMVKVMNTAHNKDVKAEFRPASTYKTTFHFKVAPLEAGSHQVSWTAIAKDGHVMKGSLSFNVAE